MRRIERCLSVNDCISSDIIVYISAFIAAEKNYISL